MPPQRVRGPASITALLALPFVIGGCAQTPSAHALRLHDSHIVEGLPQPQYEEAWYGVPLDNDATSAVKIESMQLLDASNLVVGKPFIVDIAHGDYIDWHAPPGTKRMQIEIANRMPLVGFRIPPQTRGRFEAVVLVRNRGRSAASAVSGSVIRYEIDGHDQQETWLERASLTAPK